MCGIAGYFADNGFNEQTLRSMSDAIAHRGPDDDGFFVENNCGLAHRRLSIIDLSAAANQPMLSHDGRYVMVFNGEVYNYKEVQSKYKINCKTHSDSEVILESFAIDNYNAIQHWNGMFAVAIYDKHQEKLYLIRDRIGVKPVYYFQNKNQFAFASEIKALLKVDAIKNNLSLNNQSCRDYLNTGFIPQPYTLHNEIKKIPSGSYSVISKNEFSINQYWKADERIYPSTIKKETEAKIILNDLMLSSVKYRMISDVPYGTFLSGGIDSSLVTAVAQKISAVPVKTFSISFKEETHNEAEYALKVSKHLGTDHHAFTVTEKDALDLMEQMMDAYDEPIADGSCIPTMLVSKLARHHVTMVLTGDGGDELFMGYGTHIWANRLKSFLAKNFKSSIALGLGLVGGKYRRVQHMFTYKNDDDKIRNTFSQEIGFFSDVELDKLIVNKEIIAREFDTDIINHRKLSASEKQALFDLKYYLRDDLLVKVDIASMQFSLEARTPFLDYRLVEFALNLDESLKIKNGESKYLLKQVLYNYLPKELFERPKWGFSIPLKKWLKGDLKYLIDTYLHKDVVSKHNIVDHKMVESYVRKFLSSHDYLFNRIWALVLLHRWLEKNHK